MRLLLVRHAPAIDREAFCGDDMQRPLTKAGRKKGAAAFHGLYKLYPKIQAVYSSPATRSVQTAEILGRIFGLPFVTNDLLLPGIPLSSLKAWTDLIARSLRADTVLLVGHEPELSALAWSYMQGSHLTDIDCPLKIKKAGCIEIEIAVDGELCHTVLRQLLCPNSLRLLKAKRCS